MDEADTTNSHNNPTFNAGLEFTYQISKLLWTCSTASIQNDLSTWLKTLRMVYNNSSYYINPDDRNKFDNVFSVLDGIREPPFRTQKEEIEYIQSRQALLDLDKELRYKLHEVGLIMPKADDPRKAMRH